MTSELDALWNEFAAETEDHLDSLERLLSDPAATWPASEIGALFRYFHSLKGTFLAMGFGHAEAVAHRCEDILALVREGKAPLDSAVAGVLLRAVDRLKNMRDDVLATRQDARPATDILAELDKHSRGDAPRASADAVSTAQNAPLSDDPEMLGIYSELLEQRLGTSALALSDAAPDRAVAAEACSELAYGAQMMGFDSLSDRLNTLADLAVAESPERAQIIGVCGDVREQVKIIEELTGHRSGADVLATALARQLKPDYAAGLDALAVTARPDNFVTATDLLAAAEAVRALAAGQGFAQAERLLILIAEKARSLSEADLSEHPALLDLVRETAAQVRLAADTGTDIAAHDADALASLWETSLRGAQKEAAQERAEITRLSRELLATLSPEQSAKLERAIADGQHIFELLLDLESHPEVAGDVLAWLSNAVQAITSHTAHRRGAGCFEFLIVSEHPLDWVQAQLAALDPEQVCLRGVKMLGGPSAQGGPEAGDAAAAPSRTPLIRVPSEKVDDLMAEIGEMRSALAAFADILQQGALAKALREVRRRDARHMSDGADGQNYRDAIEADLRDLRDLHNTLESAHRRIWGVGLQLRVIPVDGLFGRLSRAARDLAEKLGKEISVVVEGREVRIDKSIVDVLIDPLMHMVRNAVDHGIEAPAARAAARKPRRATLTIAASENGNRIEIVIADDGQGLDHSRIAAKAVHLGLIGPADADRMTDEEIGALIFRPGFSTAAAVTEISGRGVGLDVVETTLQRLGGTVEVRSALGAGTKFTLRLPISAALLRTLLVEVGGQVFALPERQVVSVRVLEVNEIEQARGQNFVLHRGAAIPVRDLAQELGFPSGAASTASGQVVIVAAGARVLGLAVDRVLRFQDLFLKELHPVLAAIPSVAGTSVLGDGRPVLVLDPSPLANSELNGGTTTH
ncbi:MAG: chemotaxis protein CheW [Pseudomonadota bacterium]